MLNLNYLQDTIEATAFTYEKMLGTGVTTVGTEVSETNLIKVEEITALIGFNGEVLGSMFISMKNETAFKTISKFLMFEQTELNDDIFDGMEEIVNIISGAAAAKFKKKTGLGLPTILLGENQKIRGHEDAPWKLQRMKSTELGEFLIGVTLKEVK